jgi:hypothetical protein
MLRVELSAKQYYYRETVTEFYYCMVIIMYTCTEGDILVDWLTIAE